ncbi:MAG: class I SAM-dependent methyltransferase [Bacteroidales bacterium]|nr:class I SAM-dependent methyltransferase [Bacteroidales bacterium]
MPFTNYFSKDADKRAKFIFNTLAIIFSKMDFVLKDRFDSSFKVITQEIEIKGKTVLDIGTATGDWASMFINHSAKEVHGLDFAKKMIVRAKRKYPKVNFFCEDAKSICSLPDKSFDIVTTSYVLHGMKKEARIEVLNEMKRLSKSMIIINDFYGKTPIFMRFLETVERSDYKNFKNEITDELFSIFKNCKSFNLGKGHGLYFCQVI